MFKRTVVDLGMGGSTNQQVSVPASPRYEIIEGSLHQAFPENRTHAGPDGRRMIRVHPAIQQKKSIRSNGIDGAQDCPDIAGVLRRNQRHTEMKVTGLDIIQSRLTLAHDRQEALRVFFFCYGTEQLRCQRNTADAKLGLPGYQALPKITGQLVRCVYQCLDRPAGLNRLTNMMNALHQEQARLVTFFALPQGPDLFDKRIGMTRDEVGHALILPESAIIRP